jgi:hypothetical protein
MNISFLIYGMSTGLVIDSNANRNIHYNLMEGNIVRPFMQTYQYQIIGVVPNQNDNSLIVNLRPYCEHAIRIYNNQNNRR